MASRRRGVSGGRLVTGPGTGAPARRERGGRDGVAFARDRVDEIQRARVLGAMGDVVAEGGMGAATVAHVVARAGVSRRTFYELFADREACFLAAFDQAVRLAGASVVPAYVAGGGRWPERVRAGLVALLAFLESEPELGALCVVHALGAGEQALARRAEVVRVLAGAVAAGTGEARKGRAPAPLAAEGVVGAVLGVLHTQLAKRERGPLMELVGPLMSMIVLPYLGPATAARELERPVVLSGASAERRHVREDPLKGLEMRVTYRTVRVLLAIAGEPGASNRAVGDAAGIADQGQASKLLQRLEHLGLIENTANDGGGVRGEPNAWRLTPRGERLQSTLQAQPDPIV